MPQNVSAAVMQQRQEARDALDDFPTPPWATRALCEWLLMVEDLSLCSVREPAANRGHMARPLAEYFPHVEASDVHDYGAGFAVRDYLFPPEPPLVDWTITNPPFTLAQQFAALALATSSKGVALFVRSAFLEGGERFQTLFSVSPPSDILQFCERVVIHKGRLVPEGSSATAYCWLVWRHSAPKGAPRFRWIPPGSRVRLERLTDYPRESELSDQGPGLFDA